MPNPKLVISVGACAISGGIFHDTESFVSPIQDIIPVDVTVPGCPPTPIQILEGLLLTVGKLENNLGCQQIGRRQQGVTTEDEINHFRFIYNTTSHSNTCVFCNRNSIRTHIKKSFIFFWNNWIHLWDYTIVINIIIYWSYQRILPLENNKIQFI